MQPSFFDLDNRHEKLNERDPLVMLNKLIDWESFRPTLEEVRERRRKSNVGRKPIDAIIMFKALVLQHLHNISDDELEFQIRDRYSFCRFLGLWPEDRRKSNSRDGLNQNATVSAVLCSRVVDVNKAISCFNRVHSDRGLNQRAYIAASLCSNGIVYIATE